MSTDTLEIEKVDFIQTELQKFNIADTTIQEWKEKFSILEINGIEDKAGYDNVREARLFIKGRRVEVEKTSKLLKEDALSFQRAVNAEEKRIIALIDPIESGLEAKEKAFEVEKQRIKEEKERKEQERVNIRISSLLKAGCAFNGSNYSIADIMIFPTEIKTTTDIQFEEILNGVKAENEKELSAKAEIERLQKEEAERIQKERQELLAIREEQEKQAAELKRQQDEINAQKQKIENDRIAAENKVKADTEAKQRAIELERTAAEAAKKAKADLLEKQRIEAERKAETERKAKARTERLEALKPVKQKLTDFANSLTTMQIPVFNDIKADQIMSGAKELLGRVSFYILEKSEIL
jgi:hypothetical protein